MKSGPSNCDNRASSVNGRANGNGLVAITEWIHRHFLWLLVGSYLLAALWPGPGLAIRGLTWGEPGGAGEITAPMLLLALLLLCAATVVRWEQVLDIIQHPGILLVGVAAIWLVPALYVSLLGWALSPMLDATATMGVLLGLALVAAMPVANSSVAWTQNAHGNVSLGLGLIVLSILLSPLATPQMLTFMGLSLSAQETDQLEQLIARFSGAFFIIWVILPSMAGVAINRWAGKERIQKSRGAIRIVSALALLTLNYANASLAMPKVFEREAPRVILLSAALAVSLQLLGILSAWVMTLVMTLKQESFVSLGFAFSMKHTGLALVLAGEVLRTEPRVILLIVLATLLQHIVAGLADWCWERVRNRGQVAGGD